MWLLSIVVFLLIFSGIIIVHEFGHFYAARKSGVKVLEFSLGFGKTLWKKKVGETSYCLNAIPFGGFVHLLGEEEKSDDPRSFDNAPLFNRILVTVGGVLMNFIAAILLLTVLFTVGTNPILVSKADLKRAEAAGVITLGEINEEGKRKILDVKQIKKPFPASLFFAVSETFRISVAVVQKVGEIPVEIIEKRRLPAGLSGPIGIAEATHRILPLGVLALIKLAAMLSISLAVFNILPFPALDGGRLVFQIFEAVTRRKPNKDWEGNLHYAGFMLLMGLIVWVTWNDVSRLVFG